MATGPGSKPPVRRVLTKEDLELSAAAEALLASIDESARPKELALAFPRIVNRMAGLWKTQPQMNHYFEELLTDTRGNRKGFSLDILMELTALKDYYQSKVFPPARGDVWDSTGPSGRKR